MVYCFCQYSLEGPNNQKTIYYKLATHQMPHWILLTPAVAVTTYTGACVLSLTRLKPVPDQANISLVFSSASARTSISAKVL